MFPITFINHLTRTISRTRGRTAASPPIMVVFYNEERMYPLTFTESARVNFEQKIGQQIKLRFSVEMGLLRVFGGPCQG